MYCGPPRGGWRGEHNAVTRMQYTHFSPQYYIINVDINFTAWVGNVENNKFHSYHLLYGACWRTCLWTTAHSITLSRTLSRAMAEFTTNNETVYIYNTSSLHSLYYAICQTTISTLLNPLNAMLNPIRHFLALLGAHHILHVSRIRVK